MPLYLPASASSGGSGLYQATGYDALIMGESGLTHYYKGLETHTATTLADSVGSQAITLNGNVKAGYPGVVPDGTYSIRSHGLSGDNATFPVATFLPASSASSFSIEFWCRMENTVAPGSVQILFTSDSGNNVMVYSASSGNLFQMYINGGQVVPATAYAVRWGIPHHVVYTFTTPNNSKLYVNNILVMNVTTPVPSFPGSGNGQLFMFNTNTDPAAASMHKIAAYNVALTQTQVTNHFLAGVPYA